MRIVFFLVLIVGVGLAAFAVSVAMDRFDQYQTAIAQQRDAIVPTTEVYVATRQVRYGDEIRHDDVRAIRWPAEHVPFGAFTSLEALFPPDIEEPRIALRVMEADEPILMSKVTAPGEDAGVASRLEIGQRALALQVDVTSGVSGFLRPGDRVDVYWTGSVNGLTRSNRGEVTKLIEAGVRLIAVDQSAGGDLNGAVIARTVTVAARPEQVAGLAQAQSTGRLTLSLLGAGDDTVASAIEVDQRALLGLAAEIQEEAKIEEPV
ncbi:MAG: Flp pilus assembly protein CpaB, partial [Roseicyclus sp.]